MDVTLFEAQLWCSFCLEGNGGYSLRTDQLRPTRHLYEVFDGLSPNAENYKQEYSRRLDKLEQITEYVVQKRSELIRNTALEKKRQRLLPGRVLRYIPFNSTGDGLSEMISGGIFDQFDEPGWDGWVRYVVCTEELKRWQEGAEYVEHLDFLLCWIPQPLVDRVDEAVRGIADFSIEWHTGLL